MFIDAYRLLFFRAFNGRPVVYGRPVKFNRCWTSREFAHELEAHYYHRWWFFRAVKPTRIKFVYFVAIGTVSDPSSSNTNHIEGLMQSQNRKQGGAIQQYGLATETSSNTKAPARCATSPTSSKAPAPKRKTTTPR